ncbi:MAG: DNA integrity scanning diadenylate cyclase DisA [Halanaerobiales bacterium]|nr:DNA integrity scanning diadenylate cyclase DisA [Halanaerobiales bacterium]
MKEHEEWLNEVLELIAPGTQFREGLENILRAKTGGLIILTENNDVIRDLVDGGFKIDAKLTSTNLYELAKMDGAIVLDKAGENILFANALLIPDPSLSSSETGARHRTAERVAKQTSDLVIAISERRDIITLYKNEKKHVLEDIRVVLSKANQAVQTLEKYRKVFDQTLINLSALEFENLVTIADVVTVIKRAEMVLKIKSEIERYILELGNEGRLIKMQLEELVMNVDEENKLLIKDYISEEKLEESVTAENIIEELNELNKDDMLSTREIRNVLGHGGNVNSLDLLIDPRGYRILRKIPRLPMPVIENLVNEFGDLNEINVASLDELDEVEGVGEVRAQAIKDGLRRLRDQVLLDRHI